MGVPRPVLLALVWLLGVALATGTGLLAVRLVAEQVGDDALPTVDVRAALSGGPVLTTGGTTVPVVRPSAAPRPTGTRPTSASRPAATTRPAPQPTEVRTSAATSSATSSPRPTATPRTTAVSAPRTFSLTGERDGPDPTAPGTGRGLLRPPEELAARSGQSGRYRARRRPDPF